LGVAAAGEVAPKPGRGAASAAPRGGKTQDAAARCGRLLRRLGLSAKLLALRVLAILANAAVLTKTDLNNKLQNYNKSSSIFTVRIAE
jgi:hypothetical protein